MKKRKKLNEFSILCAKLSRESERRFPDWNKEHENMEREKRQRYALLECKMVGRNGNGAVAAAAVTALLCMEKADPVGCYRTDYAIV